MKEIRIEVGDTAAMRSILRDIAVRLGEDEQEAHSDQGDIDKAAACILLDMAITTALERDGGGT